MSKKIGRGESLDPTTRAKYEKRFGVDLGHVRIITGEFAEEFNRKREAYAVTIGGTGLVLMGNSPDKAAHTAAGQGLLAHELTHVAQATRGIHRHGQFDNTLAFTQEDEEHAHREGDIAEQEAKGGGQGATTSSAEANQAQMKSAEKKKEQLEKIRTRAIEMLGDAARMQQLRNGSARRA